MTTPVTNNERQKRHRQKMADRGLKQVTGYVPEQEASAVRQLMAALAENPELEVAALRCARTGRFVKI